MLQTKVGSGIEDIREHDEAMVATGGKMTNEEFRNKKKQGLAAALARPRETFLDLRLCINTFCAFLWPLFGEQCEYYQSLMDVRDTLLLQEVSYMRAMEEYRTLIATGSQSFETSGPLHA